MYEGCEHHGGTGRIPGHFFKGASVLGFMVAALAAPAAAQDALRPVAAESTEEAGGVQGGRLDEIIVTAQKKAENVMDVPVAISALSGEELERYGVSGTAGLQFSTPGIVVPTTGPSAQPYIRGVGSRLLQNGLDPSVAIYIDERYIARQSNVVFDLMDVQRVEVLKGPQGVLFGRNSSAGAIRVITSPVSRELKGYVEATFGSYGQKELEGVINVPVGETFGVRISGAYKTRDGYTNNIASLGRHEWDDKDLLALRVKFQARPTDKLTLNLTAAYSERRDNEGGDIVSLGVLPLNVAIGRGGISGLKRGDVGTSIDDENAIRDFSTQFDLTYEFGGLDLKAITTYGYVNNDLVFDADGTSARVTDAYISEQSKVFTQEIQATSTGTGPLRWVMGGYYYNEDTDWNTVVDIGAAITNQGSQHVLTEALAGFGQVEYEFAPGLTMIAGGRYSWERKSVDLRSSGRLGSFTVPITPFEDTVSFKKFTPRTTLQYKFADTMIYATFSRGFKSGGFNYPAVGQKPLNPEVLDMYEVGLKSELLDRTLRLAASAYYYDYSNLQVTRAAGIGVGTVVVTENAANARLYGLDVEANFAPSDNLTLNAGFSLQKSQYRDFLASAKVYRGLQPGGSGLGMTDVGFDAAGQTLLRAPRFSGFVSGVYEVHLPSSVVPISIAYSYKSDFLFDFVLDPSTDVLRQKAYGLLNASIGYEPSHDRWRIKAWVQNLTNAKYFDDVVAAGNGIRGSYGSPRTYGIDLRYAF